MLIAMQQLSVFLTGCSFAFDSVSRLGDLMMDMESDQQKFYEQTFCDLSYSQKNFRVKNLMDVTFIHVTLVKQSF